MRVDVLQLVIAAPGGTVQLSVRRNSSETARLIADWRHETYSPLQLTGPGGGLVWLMPWARDHLVAMWEDTLDVNDPRIATPDQLGRRPPGSRPN